MTQYIIIVYNECRTVSADPATPLLWVLREHLGLTGTKFGCGAGLCGACTVHADGAAVKACTYLVDRVGDSFIATIESLSEQDPLMSQWAALQVPQCGYCQPAMLMTAMALLAKNPNPDAETVRAGITNLCRCGTLHRVERAVLAAAKEVAGSGDSS